MNRRGFFASMLKAGVAFTILPPAKTYERIWKAVATPQINPEWVNAPYEVSFYGHPFNPSTYTGEWLWEVVRDRMERPILRFERDTISHKFVPIHAR